MTDPIWLTPHKKGIILNVRVIPRAAKDAIMGLYSTAVKVRIQAPPVEGKANAYLIKFLSKKLGIPRADIVVLSGETGRNKRLLIHNPSPAVIKQLNELA